MQQNLKAKPYRYRLSYRIKFNTTLIFCYIIVNPSQLQHYVLSYVMQLYTVMIILVVAHHYTGGKLNSFSIILLVSHQ